MTTLVSLGILLLLSQEGFESEEIADLAGWNQRSPLYAGVMAVCLLSLAGIPPLVGGLRQAGCALSVGRIWAGLHLGIAVFAVLMSLIGAAICV